MNRTPHRIGTLALICALSLSCSDSAGPVAVATTPTDGLLRGSADAEIVIQPPTASSSLPFGPEEYFKPKGSAKIFQTDVVIDLVEFESPFRIVVENGNEDGTLRVSSAWIDLDGAPVFTPDDFSQNVARVEKEVSVPGASVLHVRLADEPGSKVRIWIQDSGTGAVGPGGGDVVLGDGDIVVSVPEGAVTGDQEITAEEAPPPPDETEPVEVFEFGPDGTTFDEPVQLTVPYDAASLPTLPSGAPVDEQTLALFKLVNGVWELLEGSTVDPSTGTVSGFTSSFSTFGVLTATRVCPGGGGGPSQFPDIQSAYDATVPGGTIQFCDGVHAVEGVVLDAPVTIEARPNTTPILQTTAAREAFLVDGITTGVVQFDGLTFDFDTPTGPDGPTRSYAIRAQGTYDEVRVLNSTFDVDAGARGGVLGWDSTEPDPRVDVDNSIFQGGAFGVAFLDTSGDVTNSQFSGQSFIGVSHSNPNVPGGGTVQFNQFFSCGSRCVRPTSNTVVHVLDNTFDMCGTVRCVSVGGAAHVEVRRNNFAALVLTGDAAPDPNNVVAFFQASTGVIDDNDFLGCAYFNCVGLFTADVTVSNNRFTHVAGQTEHPYSAIVTIEETPGGLVDGNTLHSCGVQCYQVLDGANVTIRNETITVPSGHGTLSVLDASENLGWAGGLNTVTYEDNVMVGTGLTNPADESTYPATQGIGAHRGTITANRNSFIQVANGVVVSGASSLTGRDNTFDQTLIAVNADDPAAIDFQFNDFTNAQFEIGGTLTSAALTCNYWDAIAGPQNPGGLSRSSYDPWSMTPIANTGAVDCSGQQLRVASTDNGSGLPFVPTVDQAVSTIPVTGNVLVSDGTHSVEGVVVDRPMTISGEGSGAVLQTSVEDGALNVDGVSQGTVRIEGLTFDFATPTPHAVSGRTTYAVRASGTYDQVEVRNSTFNIDPAARGSIVAGGSTEPGANLMVDDNTFNGGVFGVALVDVSGDVTNSRFYGPTIGVSLSNPVTPGGGTVQFNQFFSCGSRCVRPTNNAAVNVLDNTFDVCGTLRCVSVGGAAHVEIRRNNFAAPVLTGDAAPDPNNIVGFFQASTGVIDDNDFLGCAYFNCVGLFTADVVVTNNRFTHVAGQTEHPYSAIVTIEETPGGLVDGNTLHSCGVQCYQVLDGANVTIRNETITVPEGHGTMFVLLAAKNNDWTGGLNTVLYEDNVMTGSGVPSNPLDETTYPSQVGLEAFQGNVTMNRNSFTNVGTGVVVSDGSSLTGRDNTLDGMATAFIGHDPATVDFRFNDFTNFAGAEIWGSLTSGDLTCNWWDNVLGPQSVTGPPPSVYTPFATAAIANTAATGCSP